MAHIFPQNARAYKAAEVLHDWAPEASPMRVVPSPSTAVEAPLSSAELVEGESCHGMPWGCSFTHGSCGVQSPRTRPEPVVGPGGHCWCWWLEVVPKSLTLSRGPFSPDLQGAMPGWNEVVRQG